MAAHLHTFRVELNFLFYKSIKAFAPWCLWAKNRSSQLRWSCWLENPRGDLARAPDHFNHSCPLTGSQISLCSLGTRCALTNHLPSPSLFYLSLISPSLCHGLTQWKKTAVKKIWDWFICFSVLWDGVLSLSFSPDSLPLFLHKLKPISEQSTCSGECRASEE